MKPYQCLSLCSYTVNGETYSQSNAIVRHLARKHGLYGASEHEALRADAILDGIDDIRRKYFMVVYMGLMQPGGLDTYWERQCDPSTIAGFNGGAHFEFLNRIFKKSRGSKGFAVGNQLSIAGTALDAHNHPTWLKADFHGPYAAACDHSACSNQLDSSSSCFVVLGDKERPVNLCCWRKSTRIGNVSVHDWMIGIPLPWS